MTLQDGANHVPSQAGGSHHPVQSAIDQLLMENFAHAVNTSPGWKETLMPLSELWQHNPYPFVKPEELLR